MKTLFRARTASRVDRAVVRRRTTGERDPPAIAARIARELGFPCFVKPANLGSSVGISKVKDRRGSGRRDRPGRRATTGGILVERGDPGARGRGARCSATTSPASVPGEVAAAARVLRLRHQVRRRADRRFKSRRRSRPRGRRIPRAGAAGLPGHRLRGHGARRLLPRARRPGVLVNEINTIPGFTAISPVPEALGGERPPLPRAGRPPDRPGARTPRR